MNGKVRRLIQSLFTTIISLFLGGFFLFKDGSSPYLYWFFFIVALVYGIVAFYLVVDIKYSDKCPICGEKYEKRLHNSRTGLTVYVHELGRNCFKVR